ncbi:MAG TPA: metal ABC transporter ATP-binding protein [Actinomycetales bacterium]|nr:metal ABC transporter ATP-binding protein [Actinomycetales bacterium]
MTPVVRMRGVAVGYGARPVVHDVDLDVAAGEVVAVLGANGSGKTTLVRGLLGLAEVMAGEIELFGTPVGQGRDAARIGYVPQRHTVGGPVPSTAREVVTSGRLARQRWWARRTPADRDAVEDALMTVGLADRAGEDVARLSGGQQRRVLIARALAGGPDVLVMDEPTAGVDAPSQVALADTLRRLAASGVTLIVVTHEVGPLAGTISRAVVMQRGRIGYDGPLTPSMLGASDDVDPGGWDAGWDHGHHHQPDDGSAGWVPDVTAVSPEARTHRDG